MSFGFGLTSGLRALTASRLGMQTAGNNISNANTPGYSRQRVSLSSSIPYGLVGNLQIGTGVDVTGISRLVDDGLERRLQLQLGLVGAAELDETRYREIESIFGEPDAGLSNSYKDMFSALDQLRTDPGDRALRGGLIQAGSSLAQQFQLVSNRLGDLGDNTFDEVRGLTRQVNQRTEAIALLNRQIISAEANGSDANDLRDTRAAHVKELGKLIDVRAIERSSGSLDLLVGGSFVVAGDKSTELRIDKGSDDRTKVMVGSSTAPAVIRQGRIAALLEQEKQGLPSYLSRIDDLARSTILEWNRLHTTGMPASGPFRSLTSAYGAEDGDGDGLRGDELLSQSTFPFDVQRGSLYIAVSDTASGAMERTRIDIDPSSMTLEGLAGAIDDIDHLNASVDPTGRLRIIADSGYGFDFSPRLDPNPDNEGTFGGINPTIGSGLAGPYDLTGQTFPVSFDVVTGSTSAPVTTSVTLDASDFSDISSVSADDLAAAINDDLGTEATARSVGGRLVLQSNQGGASSQLRLTDTSGSVLADLDMSSTTAIGRDSALEIGVEGTYAGLDNQNYSFVPESDGTIGQTANLRVRVLDQDGNVVTTLDVGDGYEPGQPLALGNGISVSFGAGDISATAGQVFSFDALADSDTSDVLVATGLNTFFLGSSASDITVNPDLLDNPDRLAAGIGNASGDAGNLARLVALRNRDLGDLDGNTIEDFYADVVGDVGFETAAARSALSAQNLLLGQLEADRESVSGINLDEEMVDMLKYQQSYEAAARFISVAQEMTDTLINLGR